MSASRSETILERLVALGRTRQNGEIWMAVRWSAMNRSLLQWSSP